MPTIRTGTTAEARITQFMIEPLPAASMRRAYPEPMRAAAAAVLLLLPVLLAAGCGGSGGAASILDQGLCSQLGTHCMRVTPAEAVRDVRSARLEWLGEVRANAIRDSTRHFPNLPRTVFAQRLERQAERHDFAVESITWRHAGAQDVPDVVVESSRYAALARALPAVLDAVDPPPRSNSRAYEAIFIEAVDPHHVPFVAVFDSLRDHVMGGQWARSEALFPYAHG